MFGPVTISNNTVENASVAGDQLDSPLSQTVTGDNLQHDAIGVDVQNGTVSLQNLTLEGDATGFTALASRPEPVQPDADEQRTAGGSISNVATVNDTISTGNTGVTVTITAATCRTAATRPSITRA